MIKTNKNNETIKTTDWKIKLRSIIGIGFFLFIVSLVVWSKIQMVISPLPQKAGVDYSQYAWYIIPFIYVWNYFANAGITLLFAFLMTGIIQVFINQDVIIKYLGSGKKRNYLIAVLLAPLFITCSCSVVPIYAALLMSGAGIGVAMTFLLMAPAANFLTLWMTGEYIGWDLVVLRFVFSAIAAIMCGMLYAKTKTARELQKQYETIRVGRVKQLIAEKNVHDKVLLWYQSSWQMIKVVMPYLIVGLVIVSYLAAYLPEEMIQIYFVGFTGILLAAALGGPIYTPTLVEIVLVKEMMDKGMPRSAALAFMMGQPYDFVQVFPASKFFKWKGVALYCIIFFLFSVLSGVLYGLYLGELP